MGALLVVTLWTAQAQDRHTQTIRGTVTDEESHEPLSGVHVFINELNKGTVTNENGEFTLVNIPVGRHSVKFSYLGYHPVEYSDVIVSTGKEVVLTVHTQRFR